MAVVGVACPLLAALGARGAVQPTDLVVNLRTASPADQGPRPWTIARRIAWLALVPALLVIGVGAGVLRQQMHSTLYTSMAHTLQDKHQRVAARLRLGAQGTVIEPTTNADEFSTIYSGWYWQAQVAQVAPGAGPSPSSGSSVDAVAAGAGAGAALAPASARPAAAASGHAGGAQAAEARRHGGVRGLSRSLWDAPAIVSAGPVGPPAWGLMAATGPLGEPLIGWQRATPVTGLDRPVTLSVYGPAEALRTSLQRIDRILLATTLALMLLLTTLLAVQLRVGLLPLRRFAQAVAAQRQPDAAGQPALQDLRVGADLAPLQQELHALLQQNTQVVARARAHAADLNHALKRPLAVLTASASQQPQLDSAVVLQHARAMAQLIDRYQARTWSEASHARAATGVVDVMACLRDMLHAMRRLHAAQELDWRLQAPPSARWSWRGDATDLEEALGNLLDNAGKWAASTVAVGAQRDGDALLIQINDDGPGMSAEQLQRAGQRGLRFDETVAGQGLGVAIARQIAQAYGGALTLERSPTLKGLRASLRLGGVLA